MRALGGRGAGRGRSLLGWLQERLRARSELRPRERRVEKGSESARRLRRRRRGGAPSLEREPRGHRGDARGEHVQHAARGASRDRRDAGPDAPGSRPGKRRGKSASRGGAPKKRRGSGPRRMLRGGRGGRRSNRRRVARGEAGHGARASPGVSAPPPVRGPGDERSAAPRSGGRHARRAHRSALGRVAAPGHVRGGEEQRPGPPRDARLALQRRAAGRSVRARRARGGAEERLREDLRDGPEARSHGRRGGDGGAPPRAPVADAPRGATRAIRRRDDGGVRARIGALRARGLPVRATGRLGQARARLSRRARRRPPARLFRAVATLDGVGAGDPSAVPEEGIAPEEVPACPPRARREAAATRCAEPFAARPRRADRGREFVRAFDERDGLAETLVASAERFQAEAWAEAREKEREKGSSGRARKKSGAKDVPLARRDPPAYARTLGALMDVILFAHKRGELEVSPETARRLWSAFVETPPGAARAPAQPSASDGPPAAEARPRRGGGRSRGRRRRFIPRPRPDVDDEAPRRVAERGAARGVSAMLTEKPREPAAEIPPAGGAVQGAVSAGGGGRRPRRRRDRRRGRRRREGPLGGTPLRRRTRRHERGSPGAQDARSGIGSARLALRGRGGGVRRRGAAVARRDGRAGGERSRFARRGPLGDGPRRRVRGSLVPAAATLRRAARRRAGHRPAHSAQRRGAPGGPRANGGAARGVPREDPPAGARRRARVEGGRRGGPNAARRCAGRC